MAHRAIKRMTEKTPLTTGYRVGQALLFGLLLCCALGCGSLWQAATSPGHAAPEPQSSSAVAVAVAQPMQAEPAQPTIGGPKGQAWIALTPVLKPEATPTPTVVPTLKPTPADTAFSLLILHTNDTRGYVDPCG